MPIQWISFIQKFDFLIKHKARVADRVADALSCKHALLTSIEGEVIAFENLPTSYKNDPDFHEILLRYQNVNPDDFHLVDDYFLSGKKVTCYVFQILFYANFLLRTYMLVV